MRPLRIIDLAEVLVEELAPRYGKNPQAIKYKVIGMRPGEKMHEPLITTEESKYMTEQRGMFVLHNVALLQFGIQIPTNKKADKMDEYNSGKMPLMSKKEIKEMLLKKKLI